MNADLETNRENVECKHMHMCELSRYILKIDRLISKRACEKISFGKGQTKECKLDDNTIIKINESGIYIHIKFM